MGYDGTLKFDTRIDSSNFSKEIKNIKNTALDVKKSLGSFKNALSGGINTKSAVKSLDSLKNVSDSTKESIKSILDDAEKSSRSKAAKISSILKKEGYNTSDSMRKAWSLIEREVKSTNDKNVKDTKKANNEMADSFKMSAKSIKSSLGGLIGTLATCIGIWQLIKFGKESIELGSDMAEVQNVVDTAFGIMSYKIEEFSNTCIENFGMSKLTAKQMASTFMAMSRGMGQGLDAASDMAVELTGRLGDVASFYNKSMSEVETIGRAVLSGETEPLKAIGVVMTETNLDAWTLSKGYSTLYSKMDQTNKLAVRQKYFLEQTSLAAGDFVKTQDSWANQTRILSERFKEFKSIIGSELIAVLSPVVKELNNIMSILLKIAEESKEIFEYFGLNVDAGSSGATSDLSGNMQDIADSTETANKNAKELNKTLTGIDKLNNITSSKKTKQSSNNNTGGLDNLPVQKEDEVSKKLEKWNDLLQPLKTSIDNFKDSLSNLENFNSTALNDFYENFVKPLGEFTLSENGFPRLIDITTRFNNETDWKQLNTSLSSWFSSLEPIAELTFDGIVDFYDYFIEPMASWTVGDALPQLLDILTKFNTTVKWDDINKALERFWKAITPLSKSFGQGLIDFYSDLMDLGADFINLVVPGGINGLASALEKIDPDIIQSIAYALAAFATSVAAIKITKGLLTGLGSLAGALGGVSGAAAALVGAIGSFEFAHLKWEDVFEDYDFEEVREGLKDMFSSALGDNFVSDILADSFGGLGAIFSGMATPKEWLSAFKLWARDCYKRFKNEVKKLAKKEVAAAFYLAINLKYSLKHLKKSFSKLQKQLAKGDFKGAMLTIGVDILKADKVKKKVTRTIGKIKDLSIKASILPILSAKKIKGDIKEKLKDIAEKAISLKAEITTNFNITKAWYNIQKLWNNSKKVLGISMDWIGKNKFLGGLRTSIIAAINSLIKAMNKALTFKIPKWVPKFGGKKWGVNMKQIKVPKLATGAVIPPNKEFLAVLGDQKRGTNVEAPLSTIQKALSDELDRRGGAGGNGDIILKLYLDGKQIYENVVKHDKAIAASKGKKTALARG